MMRLNYRRLHNFFLQKLLQLKRAPETIMRSSAISPAPSMTNISEELEETPNTNKPTNPPVAKPLTATEIAHTVPVKVATRQYAQYQFRTQKTSYYPDRSTEMKRLEEKTRETAQAVVELRHDRKSLPKDYYYKILGVSKRATVAQIRQSFYALAKRYHPDTTHSEEMLKHFQELSNAYNILTDETKRLEYDQLGAIKDEKAFLAQAVNPITQPQQEKHKHTIEQKQKTKVQPPEHKDELLKLTTSDPDLQLSFVEATIGCKKRVDLRYLKKCTACNGKSQLLANRDVGNELCRRCNGTGQIIKKTATYTAVNVCSQCKGKRFTNRSNCDICDNRGHVLGVAQILVIVPAGSKNGDLITVENPNTKQRVNYHLIVDKSDYFRREGNDIYTEKHLNISDAILGGTFKIRGLYEELEVKVNAGTQSHTQLVLKNKGVRVRDSIGNHIITFIVRIPQTLNVKQRQLVLALAKAEDPVFDRTLSMEN